MIIIIFNAFVTASLLLFQVEDLLQDGNPAIEGQLKEKKGKWKFLKRWKTRYFTLSGAAITYNKKDSVRTTCQSLSKGVLTERSVIVCSS